MSDNTYVQTQHEEWQNWRQGDQLMTPKRVKTLSSHVLVVAAWGIDGWRAYCDSVPGQDHEIEYNAVYESGTKLEESIARSMFPMYKQIPYAK